MGKSDERINPGHGRVRGVLRVVGPLLLLAGVACMTVALVDFFVRFGDFNAGPPRLFWMFFLALPLLFAGFLMTSMGYMGAVARYVAQEQAPVGADTFNYVAGETTEGVRAIAGAVASGLRAGGVACGECGTVNDADARFCDACGGGLGEGPRRGTSTRG